MKNSLNTCWSVLRWRNSGIDRTTLYPGLRKFALFLTLLFIAASSYAQVTKVSEALTALKDGDLLNAKAAIDAASENEETKGQAQTWYYIGYIYRELSKEKGAESLAYRRGAVKYFKKCIDLEPSGKFSTNSNQQIVNIGRAYYNDAVMAINAGNAEEAEKNFVVFQAVSKIADPNVDLTDQQINVYLAKLIL